MSKNVFGADNPQGSPLASNSYDPSETTRRAPSTNGEIIAYLNGAAHDASLNKNKRIRFVQKEREWLELLKSLLSKIDCNSWIYREGKNRNLFALETLCKNIDFNFDPSGLSVRKNYFM